VRAKGVHGGDEGILSAGAQISALIAMVLAISGYPGTLSAQTLRTESYGRLPAQTLSMCLPERPDQNRRPAVILIHGGGWTGGRASSLNSRCIEFARHGFIAATVEYRLAKAEDETTRWPAQIDDVRLAFAWLRARSNEFNADPSHICAYGESAGGHLALWLGILEPQLSCIVDAFGPTDLEKLTGPAYNTGFSILFGPAVTAEVLRKASPLYANVASLPPTAMIQGETDQLVPPEQTMSLQTALRAKKVANVAYSYPGGHTWSGISKEDSVSIMNSAIEFMKTAKRPVR
jgi:acetyl esterase/lipase